jgi:hypothetical protein
MNPEVFRRLALCFPAVATWGGAFILAVLGRAGTAGANTDQIMETTGLSRTGTLKICRALAAHRLISAPDRIAGRHGTMHRFTITGAGFLLITAPLVQVDTQTPAKISA